MNNRLITIKYANIPVIKYYRNFNASINQVIIALILAIIYFKQYHPINYVQNIDIIIILTPITWQNHAYPNLLHCSLSISDFQSHSVLINIGYKSKSNYISTAGIKHSGSTYLNPCSFRSISSRTTLLIKSKLVNSSIILHGSKKKLHIII